MVKQVCHKTLSPKIPAFDHAKMALAKDMNWESSNLLALVNSYGAAGSNPAVMVREKPPRNTSLAPVQLSKYPLFISAGSVNSLSKFSNKLLGWLKSAKAEARSECLASLVFNLADRGNHALSHVFATTVSSVQDLEIKLETAAAGSGITSVPNESKPVVLVFGGQESDFIGFSEEVYKSSRVFRKHFDSVNDLFISAGLESLFPSVFQTKPLLNLVMLHSALFAVQYASAMAWMDCGLEVSAVAGHSFGQLTALCISGVLSLSDALKLVSGRASLMQEYWGPEPGSMLFLQADRPTVDAVLRTLSSGDRNLYAEIACHNGPRSHVVVGSSEAIDTLQQHITNTSHLRNSIRTKKLNVTNGFHSKFTEPMLMHLDFLARGLEWKQPKIHLETTEEFGSHTVPDFRLVSKHTRQPVFFQQAIERLTTKFAQCTWLEVGRGSSIMQLVKNSVAATQHHAFYSPQLTSSAIGQDSLTDITIDLWKNGYAVQYWSFHRTQKLDYESLSLPPYQFEKTRHWLGFTGRGDSTQDDSETKAIDDAEETHELFTFLNFNDKTKNEAVLKSIRRLIAFRKC